MRNLAKIKEKLILSFLKRDELESEALRKYFVSKYEIEVGLYSYGCFDPKRIPRGTKVGRYCSFAPTSYIFNGNHGLDFISTNPYLYNTKLGLVEVEAIQRTRCTVEDDVWLGHNSIILPSVRVVGRGAIVAAGAVVTKDVPKYSVVAGNPARVIKYRFSEEVIHQIENTRWWELSKEGLSSLIRNQREMIYQPGIYFRKEKDA